MPKARKQLPVVYRISLPDFLRRCANDHEENGMTSTAKDYRDAADEIDRLTKERDALQQLIDDVKCQLATTTCASR